ncbi:hypothetical protein HOK51_03665 [Candidatus Woesearchaeota archaeon]|jgi:hypothetical protein|nr:hypothetical protein [Candidatus Woesearchaeota archaeon]MBT7367587.1 hypothetical protein [Candidatus Woesearchaeota archaeon]
MSTIDNKFNEDLDQEESKIPDSKEQKSKTGIKYAGHLIGKGIQNLITIVVGITAAAVIVGGVGKCCHRVFLEERILENVTVKEVDQSMVLDSMNMPEYYTFIKFEETNLCVRGDYVIGENLKKGDKLNYVEWELGYPFRPCEPLVRYEKKE